MLEIRKTDIYAAWIDSLRDVQGRARILVRIERLAAAQQQETANQRGERPGHGGVGQHQSSPRMPSAGMMRRCSHATSRQK